MAHIFIFTYQRFSLELPTCECQSGPRRLPYRAKAPPPQLPQPFYLRVSLHSSVSLTKILARSSNVKGCHPGGLLDLVISEGSFRVLDDAKLSDFGNDWQRLCSVLPELAAPKVDRRFTEDDVSYARQWARGQKAVEESEDEDYEDAMMLRAENGLP
ncbi:hypothetical protein VTI74DRAFT_10657 [Chaetomium olivicolor]